jgi:hypothetical protein
MLQKMTPQQQLNAIKPLPKQNQTMTFQFLAALPDAQKCVAAMSGSTPGTPGGTPPPAPVPGCTTAVPVSSTCMCNQTATSDTRAMPPVGSPLRPPGALAGDTQCCCVLGSQSPTNPRGCANYSSVCDNSSVEWVFLGCVGLIAGGRWLTRRSRKTA